MKRMAQFYMWDVTIFCDYILDLLTCCFEHESLNIKKTNEKTLSRLFVAFIFFFNESFSSRWTYYFVSYEVSCQYHFLSTWLGTCYDLLLIGYIYYLHHIPDTNKITIYIMCMYESVFPSEVLINSYQVCSKKVMSNFLWLLKKNMC